MKNRIKVFIASLVLTLSAGAQAVPIATIGATATPDPVNVGDIVTVNIYGNDFAGGTIGGGFSFSWDTEFLTYDTSSRTFPSDMTFGQVGNVDSAAGTWTNADVTSLGGVVGPNFAVATITFLAKAATAGTAFNVEIGTFGGGSDRIWADATGFVDTNPMFTGGSVVINAVNEVPIPAAAWLFGSGLLGLAGLKRRKASA